MKRFFTRLHDQLASGRPVVLASVVGHAGSTPRSSGAMMAVFEDGAIDGSVGGGVLEAKVMAAAPALFQSGGAMLAEYLLSGSEAASLGMACGGDVTVLALRLEPTPETAALYAALARELEAGGAGVLVTELEGPDEALRVISRRLASEGEAVSGVSRPGRLPRLTRRPGGVLVAEPFAPPCVLHLAGAGHVSFFTAPLAARVGFRVRVLDDRPEFANAARFPEADEIAVVSDFADCFPEGLGPRDFAVIVTRGHLHDATVLARALQSRAGYLGMIGSKRKRTACYAALLEEGFARADLERVHCPIGLAIGAETPEEIAVSIVAELIKARASLTSSAGV